MLKHLTLLMIISALPAFMLISDGYRVKNVSKGVNYFIWFVVLTVITVILLWQFRLDFVFVIPALLFIALLAFRKKKKL
ncbi:hypothetical protein POV27_13830 [Aureisphaera galaxeae]|uniref:hypothetical protein n=1 Tax=Aureisphaera galaxeae TaxID=1538023 RepID=UPI0023500695|nr:hypothetical protein [Aureisphaera galaxeae]MDC8005136.1 hypothetical protein [Aureisphaera galaxeae]